MAQRPDNLNTALRMLELLRRIPRGRKVTTGELHQQLKGAGFERDLRTIQRQLEILSEHFDIERDERSKPYGYRWLERAQGLAVPRLTPQESLLLLLAQRWRLAKIFFALRSARWTAGCWLIVVARGYFLRWRGWAQAQAMADLAVFRAGATGLAELTARGIPAILVPYPYAAENHQEHNARALEEAGAARMILDRDLSSERLASVLTELLSEPAKLAQMAAASRQLGRPEAAADIAELVLSIAAR